MRALPIQAGSLDGIWAAASLIHLQKRTVISVLAALRYLMKPEGLIAATLTYGRNSRFEQTGWMPGRYFARWGKRRTGTDAPQKKMDCSIGTGGD